MTSTGIDTLLKEQYETYRAANARIAELSMLAIAAVTRETFPTAAGVWLTPSDQGPHMTTDSVLLVDGTEVDAADHTEWENDVWSYASNLGDEDETWMAFTVTSGERPGDDRLLDLDAVLSGITLEGVES